MIKNVFFIKKLSHRRKFYIIKYLLKYSVATLAWYVN